MPPVFRLESQHIAGPMIAFKFLEYSAQKSFGVCTREGCGCDTPGPGWRIYTGTMMAHIHINRHMCAYVGSSWHCHVTNADVKLEGIHGQNPEERGREAYIKLPHAAAARPAWSMARPR